MKKATLRLETITCPSCVQKIEKAVISLDGVKMDSLSVLFNASKIRVDFDEGKLSLEDIQKSITSLGYEVKKAQVKEL
jgi:copper chaperone